MGNGRKIRRIKKLQKLGKRVLIVAGVGLIVWTFYIGATWGPKSVDSASSRQSGVADTQLVETSKRLAREFEAIAASRTPTEADLQILREAIATQREYNLAGRPTAQERKRQDELELRLQHFQAVGIAAKSQEAEEEANKLAEAGETAAAVLKVQEALELQRDVNQRFGRTTFGNNARESQLQQRFSSMAAEPLYKQSLELEELAKAAVDRQDWEEARKLFTEARQIQGDINEEFRRSSFHSTSRQQELANQISSLKVGEVMSEIQELQKRAESQGKDGKWNAAGDLYQQAFLLQDKINRDHPQNSFASMERLTELGEARQTVLSSPLTEKLEEKLTVVRRALAAGNHESAQKEIQAASELAAKLFKQFPQSSRLNHDVRIELEYLALLEKDLPDLQTALRGNLLPIPGQPNWKMSMTPVSQRLYSRIMSRNPSQNLGLDLPVDSVTLLHAREFCRRATWILGQTVQLPTRSQFEAAIGEWNTEVLAGQSWNSGNSEGSSKTVDSGTANANGFFHLTGNLRQWTNEEADGSKAWTAGFSYDDELKQDGLFRQINRGERNRLVGFRFIVGEEAATASL